MEKYEYLKPDIRHIMALSDDERKQFIRSPRWIAYPQADRILKKLDSYLAWPSDSRMPNALLVGESNNGKTTLIQHFYNQQGKSYETEYGDLVLPIILIEAPNTANEKALYLAILEKLSAPYRETAPVEILYNQTLHLMRTYSVRMLMIDEFHAMFSGTARKQRDMFSAIKRLGNELKIPIIGAGVPSAANILFTDRQYTSRFDILELPVWKVGPELQKETFAKFPKIP